MKDVEEAEEEIKKLRKEHCEQDHREDILLSLENGGESPYKAYIEPYDFEPVSNYLKHYYLQNSLERLCMGCKQRPVDRLICLQRHCDKQDQLIGRLDGLIE